MAETEPHKSFLTVSSTYWVTFFRLSLVFLPYAVTSVTIQECLYSPSLMSVLVRPHQSLAQLEEAHAIRALASADHFSGFYRANNSVRIPPLVLAVFSPLLEKTSDPGTWLSVILIFMDFVLAYLLERIGIRLLGLWCTQQPTEEEVLQRKLPECIRPPFSHIFPIYRHDGGSSDMAETPEQQPLISMKDLPLLSAQLYYWSPFTVLPSCLYYCWQNMAPFFLVASLHEIVASGGSVTMGSFYLAVATYLEPHYVVYVVPITCLLLMCAKDVSFASSPSFSSLYQSKTAKSMIFFVCCFGIWSLFLQGMSYALVGPSRYWKVVGTIYGNTWLTTSPNLSLQWYFRMQLFYRFHDYFGAIFALVPLVLVGPLCIRFWRYPAVQLAIWTMVCTLYRPVQVLYDAQFAFCFLLCSPRSMARMGYTSVIALCCIPVPLVLNIVDHWMWLDANNGNANYIFFQCIAHNVFLAIILGQFTSASMQRDKALRLTHQEEQKKGSPQN